MMVRPTNPAALAVVRAAHDALAAEWLRRAARHLREAEALDRQLVDVPSEPTKETASRDR